MKHLPFLLCTLLLSACFDFSGQGDSAVRFDFEGQGSGPTPECLEDVSCAVRQICVRGFCTQGCRGDNDCPTGEVCGGTDAPRCTSTLACRADNDCGADTPRCHPSLAVCVACLNTTDCTDTENVCLIEPACSRDERPCVGQDYQCGQCTSNNQCASGVCDLELGRCVECSADTDCAGSLVCDPDLRICTTCFDNSHCQEPRPSCLRTPTGGQCVLCALDEDCGDGGTCNRDTLSCEGCRSDSDCRGDNLRCHPPSGLCFDQSCTTREEPALLEMRIEAEIPTPFLTGSPMVGPLQGIPSAEVQGAIVVAMSPLDPADAALAVYTIEGEEPQRVWNSAASFGAGRALALGDVDADGSADVIALRNGRLTSISANGNPQWVSGSRTIHWPALFDVDTDGFAEVIAGGTLFSETGTRIWEGQGHQGGHLNLNLPGLGMAAQLLPDAPLEIVAGGTLYSLQGDVICTQGEDGYSSVTDIDGDGDGEILVVSSNGSLRALDETCGLLWTATPQGDGQGGGLPTITDLDGDGNLEIIYVAREDVLVAVDGDGTILWESPLVGAHPTASASSLDLDGDGLPEVLVSDGEALKVFRGSDGCLLTAQAEGASHLPLSGPVIADLDLDGSAEIIVAAGTGAQEDRVVIFGEIRNRWVKTRNLWNQTGYMPSAVRDDLRAPVAQGRWWLEDAGQRTQSIATPREPAANLTLRSIPGGIDQGECPDRFTFAVGLYNRGSAPVPAGVRVVVEDPERGASLFAIESTRRLDPGEEEILLLTLDDFEGPRDTLVRILRSAEETLETPECDDTDNSLSVTEIGCPTTQ